jgi:predicted RecA/RadA family phage recombinase
MRFPGIAACILAAAAACTPCQALNATDAATAATHVSAPAQTRTAKAKPAKKAEQPAQSFITFYWSKGLEGASLFNVFREKIILTVDGKDAGKLAQGEYLSIPVQPGHHTYGYERQAFSSEGETKRELDVAQGQSAYFEIVEKNEAGFLHTMLPQPVAAEQAQAEISRLKTPLQTAAPAPGLPAAVAPTGAAPLPGVSAATAQTGGKPGKKGAAPQPVAQSYIVFYWPKRGGSVSLLTSLSEHVGVAIDDQSAGSIGEGEYISVPVQPGAHAYSWARASTVSWNDKKHPLDIQPGQSAYFEISEQQQGMVTVIYPQQVDVAQAQPLLASLKSPAVHD